MQTDNFFSLNGALGLCLMIILGWLAASLVNFLADVLPISRQLASSYCRRCGKKLPWQYYLGWKTGCPNCQRKPKLRFWLVRLVMPAIALWLFFFPPQTFSHLFGKILGTILLSYLTLVIVIDVEHRLILHKTSLFGAVFGLGTGIWLHGILATLLGCAVGLLLMWLVYQIGIGFVRLMERIRRRKIGEEAMGFGDVVLGGVIGLFLGWPGILTAIMLTFILGGVGSILYLGYAALARKYNISLTLPYGPFLAASMAIVLFFL